MKMQLKDINQAPCKKYCDYIIGKYGLHGEFDPIEVFENVPEGSHYSDVMWLMLECKKARTNEMLEYYKSKNPCGGSVTRVLRDIEESRTPEMLEYYKSIKADYADVSMVIAHCEIAQTEEMLKFYMSLEPNDRDIQWLLNMCEYAEKNQHILA